MTDEHLTRRDFLKLSSLAPFSKLETLMGLIDTNEMIKRYVSDRETLAYPTLARKNPLTAEGLEKTTRVPSESEMIEKLNNPDFFTKSINGARPIHTNQFDDTEHNFHPDMPESEADIIKQNSCGPAAIATVLKTYRYFETGVVADIRISAVRDFLEQHKYIEKGKKHNFLEWDGSMYPFALTQAFSLFSQFGYPISVVNISPSRMSGYGLDSFIVPLNRDIVLRSQELASKGGILCTFQLKYGGGHLPLMTNLNYDEDGMIRAMVIDSRGGFVQENVWLPSYIDDYNGKDGLMGIFGIIPNFKQKNMSSLRMDKHERIKGNPFN
ncbi:hypothetical protein ISR94_00425 [Candidatus Microgenomates bacterium]|nr:hypothetical protein [Candidatus Microgenomates bacterium]